jgi:lambda family phage portal protein
MSSRIPEQFAKGTILSSDGGVLIDGRAKPVWATGYSNYGANQTKNSMIGWLWRGGDADTDIGENIQVLRERSRDAFMGIPFGAAAIETLDTAVIGEGLIPAPSVDGELLGMSADETSALNQEIGTKFDWWAGDPRESDFEGRLSFYEQQSLALQTMLLSGDTPTLLPLRPRAGTLFDLRIRILESDRVRDPSAYSGYGYNGNGGWLNGNGYAPAGIFEDLDLSFEDEEALIEGRHTVFNGVEMSEEGELIAYHIANQHPLSRMGRQTTRLGGWGPYETVRVKPYGEVTGRRNMLMMFRPWRPEQRRGVPLLAIVLELLKQGGRYIDSTVVAAVIQSYFTAFITSQFPSAEILDSLLTEQQKREIFDMNPYNVQLGPGIVNLMKPGHGLSFASPTQPPTTFESFIIAMAKILGAALGIPYEVLLKQFTASYSASRAAILEFWKRVRKYRALMIDQWCQPIYEEWLADAISLGRIERFRGGWDDPYVRRAMLGCVWTGASAGSLDPNREVVAADLRVKCGYSTVERESFEMNGSNYRDNIAQQAVERDEFEEVDLYYPPYRPSGAGAGIGGAPSAQPQTTPPSRGAPAPNAPPPVPGAYFKSKAYRRATLASGLSGVFIR